MMTTYLLGAAAFWALIAMWCFYEMLMWFKNGR